MKDKPILEIHIDIAEKGLKMTTELGEVSMIPFSGTVDCELFKGIVEPWGVDTQIVDQTNMRHLSARYVLSGKDSTGQDCHIYIENNGWFSDGNMPAVFRTVPTFITDSAALAPFLHRNCFVGEGTPDDQGVMIRLFEVTEKQDSSESLSNCQ